jgi:SAM-dependent methyltransferase
MGLSGAFATHPPALAIKTKQQSKYERLWAIDKYREGCPGEGAVSEFLAQTNMPKNADCIDFGCGTGRGGLMLAMLNQAIVTLVDFAENALDEDICDIIEAQPDRLKWVQADLSDHIPIIATYGYCVNVLEHLPPEEVDNAIRNMMQAANHIFFQIMTVPDDTKYDGIKSPLHLTVQPYEWWIKKFRNLGAVVHWSQNYKNDETGENAMCRFYVSSWRDQDTLDLTGRVNTAPTEVRENMKKNAERKDEFQAVIPHVAQNTEVMMICGGPSLNDYTDEIIQLRAEGMPMITGNGTYNWAIENGMKPSMQMIIDARAFNQRFLRPVVDDCKYFIASQCHPSLFEGMPPDRTYIWHVTGGNDEDSETLDFIQEHYGDFFSVPGGSTVTLRGLSLLRMLGFHKIHMYGFDSCVREDLHHAYAQPENNRDYTGQVPVSVGGRAFRCDPWMVSQAIEFMQQAKMFGDEIDLNVVGDGLIAHIIKTGYEMVLQEEESEG